MTEKTLPSEKRISRENVERVLVIPSPRFLRSFIQSIANTFIISYVTMVTERGKVTEIIACLGDKYV